MSTRIYPLGYRCLNCGAEATFYDFYGADTQAFRDYHYNDELCLIEKK